MTDLSDASLEALLDVVTKEDESFYDGIRYLLNRDDARIVYVDGVDMLHEMGETSGTVFPSKVSALRQSPCTAHCGIQKCILIPLEWVHPQDLSKGSSKTDATAALSALAKIQERMEGIERLLHRTSLQFDKEAARATYPPT